MRYEFSEGSSNKFWQIVLKGASLTTTYGKIGSDGQTSLKTFGSDADARKEHDKLVAEKVKKGYALVGGKAMQKQAAPAKAAPAKSAAKPAPAKPSAAKPATHPGTKGARYFEFSEGSSNKFWEIYADKNSVKTRYGKIGSGGQLTLKDFSSKAEVGKEIERLINEKTKKGYVEHGGAASDGDGDDDDAGSAPVTGGNARNATLEASIVADPYDRNAWMVLADWLQDQGDPRGELMALQIGNKAKPAAKLIEQHKGYFLGPLAEHPKCYDSHSAESSKDAFTWRNGFIFSARLSHNHYANEEWQGSLAKDVLAPLLAHPSGRFITEMAFQDNNDPNDDDLQDLIDLLAKQAPRTIRKLEFGDAVDQISWYNIGDLSKLWKAVPNLRTLLIEGGSFTLGKIDLPELKRAVFETGGLSSDCGKSIATAKWPKIEHLEIYYGDDNYGGDCSIKQVKPLLDRTDLPNLSYLGLTNAMFTDDICKALPTAKILKGIKVLDLSKGCMTDEGARALADHKAAFSHLDEIILDENYITKDGAKLLKGICKKVTGLNDQKDDDDPEYRSVSVGE